MNKEIIEKSTKAFTNQTEVITTHTTATTVTSLISDRRNKSEG